MIKTFKVVEYDKQFHLLQHYKNYFYLLVIYNSRFLQKICGHKRCRTGSTLPKSILVTSQRIIVSTLRSLAAILNEFKNVKETFRLFIKTHSSIQFKIIYRLTSDRKTMMVFSSNSRSCNSRKTKPRASSNAETIPDKKLEFEFYQMR